MPVSGEILELNDALNAQPELVNSDPYNEGWMIKIRMTNASEVNNLMDAAAYEASLS